MSKKKTKADDGIPEMNLDNDEIRRQQEVLHNWRLRVQHSVTALKELQASLGKSAAVLELKNAELHQVLREGECLAALKPDDLTECRRQHNDAVSAGTQGKGAASGKDRGGSAGKNASGGKKGGSQSSKGSSRSTSANAEQRGSSAFENQEETLVAEAVVLAMQGVDDKRRAKVTAALTTYFNAPRDAFTPATSPAHPSPGQPGSPVLEEGVPVTLGAQAMRHSHEQQQQQQQAEDFAGSRRPVSGQSAASASNPRLGASAVSISLGTVGSNSGAHGGRPKEVPAALWDEMAVLRQRRLAAETEVASLSGVVQSQLERIELLQKNCMVARYGFDGAEHELSKAILKVNPHLTSVPQPVLRALPEADESRATTSARK